MGTQRVTPAPDRSRSALLRNMTTENMLRLFVALIEPSRKLSAADKALCDWLMAEGEAYQ